MRLALAALLLLAGTACAPRQAIRGEPAAANEPAAFSIPKSVPQGGLILGSVPPGSAVALLQTPVDGASAERAPLTPVRVSSNGRFVIGVGRESTGPVVLQITAPNQAARQFSIEVVKREFPREAIEGVPESTVNPPPEIAARIEREQAQVSAARKRDDDRDDFDVKFIWPVTGRISGVYGSQRVYNGTPKSPHSGLDVAAAQGTPIHAPAGGVVTFAEPDLYLTGGTVLIDHGHGVSSNFLHLSRIDVMVGERVEQGQVIGLVGATGRATGPHMHWGMNWLDVRVDPQLLVDPSGNPQ